MEAQLSCTITSGQFSGEYVAEGEMYNGEGFSMFVSDDSLECKAFPAGNDRASAWMRVLVLEDNSKGLTLLRLPRATLENGDTVTVRTDQLRFPKSQEFRRDPVERGAASST